MYSWSLSHHDLTAESTSSVKAATATAPWLALSAVHKQYIQFIVTVERRAIEQCTSEGFHSCDQPSNVAQIRSEWSILALVTLKFDGWSWKHNGTYSMLLQALYIISKPSVNSNCSHSPETPNLGQSRSFVPCDPETWRMNFKNNRTHLLWHAIFVHHFVTICELKLELRSGTDSNWFWPLWPWSFTSDLGRLHGHHFYQWQSRLNISWWYDERNIVKRCDGRTDEGTDRVNHSQTGLVAK